MPKTKHEAAASSFILALNPKHRTVPHCFGNYGTKPEAPKSTATPNKSQVRKGSHRRANTRNPKPETLNHKTLKHGHGFKVQRVAAILILQPKALNPEVESPKCYEP